MNEELHSTNEELETLNTELHRGTNELSTTNSILQSILAGLPVGVAVVDRHLTILLWNHGAEARGVSPSMKCEGGLFSIRTSVPGGTTADRRIPGGNRAARGNDGRRELPRQGLSGVVLPAPRSWDPGEVGLEPSW